MVRELFNSIAKRYDLVNRLTTLGLDKRWRRKACEIALTYVDVKKPRILDVACGTGDMIMCMRKRLERRGIPAKFYGLDCSERMLEIAKKKVPFAELKVGNAEEILFPDGSFDLVSVAFGLRNFSDREKAIGEIHRVLKRRGILLILEFSRSESLLGKLTWFYTRSVVPIIGGILTGNREAYNHLWRSIETFPSPEELSMEFEKRGFKVLTMEWFFPRIAFVMVLEKV
ncbi:ubiquinone/menaquinone biosynthesis methyltransferase [Thermococcus sp.]|uniref:ubiquinone/menaquinone biosynthesis methyltransferase n=3 Tax=Thermococcus sp. TaxID=35749 RepID=UPI002636706D|nr:ubiquinone/menaquinone biosynthesis methyltransferase [Thermococcus sp.]